MTPTTPTPNPQVSSGPDGYLAPGPFTHPRDLSRRLEALARRGGPDPAALAEVVRSVMVHPAWRAAYGVAEDEPRTGRESNLRDLRSMLARIGELQASLGRSPEDVSPLPAEAKLIGNCRHHSVLYTALLRSVGIPARARCGFGRYFEAGKWIDHWVVERWDGRRWVISDAQLDDLMRERMKFSFDPMDMPDGEFRCGGEAWLACRGGDDPGRYGIFHLNGWDFVKGNLVRDVCALGGYELLPWDDWGLAIEARAEMGETALSALDRDARATPMRVALGREAAEDLAGRPGYALPRRIRSWPGPDPVEVDLGPILDG